MFFTTHGELCCLINTLEMFVTLWQKSHSYTAFGLLEQLPLAEQSQTANMTRFCHLIN